MPAARPTARVVAVLARGLRPRWRVFALAVAAGCLYGISGAVTGWWVGRVSDAVLVPALTDAAAGRPGAVGAADAWRAGGVLAAIYLLSVVTQAVRRISAGTAMFGVQADHRRRVARRYLDLPLTWHRARPAGRLLSTAGSDVDTTWQVLAPLPFALGTVAMVLAAATAMVLADPVLALVAAVVVPAIAASSVVYQRRVSPRIARAQAVRGEVAGVAHESFEGALVVKVLGRRDQEVERFSDAADRLRDANTAAGTARGGFDAVVEALPALGVLAVLALGAVRIADGSAQTSDVVQVAYLLTLLAFPVRAIGWVLADLPRTVVGHERLDAVLSAPLREAPPARPVPGRGTGRALGAGLQRVGVRHPAAPDDAPPALDEVTLEVAAGTTTAVVGPTGSGKSTLAGLLLRLVDPTSGRVLLDGVDLRAVTDGALAEAAALVPQAVFVFDDTVRGNVLLGLEGVDDARVWSALAAARAEEFVRAMPRGLDTPVGERGTSLSGGQRQRLAIARALVRRPRLLVLDDATSALDPAVERDVLDGLRAGAPGGEGGTAPTVVVVAYRPATIALADEVVHLVGGRVVDRGRPEDLLARDPGYRELVTAYARAARERELAAL